MVGKERIDVSVSAGLRQLAELLREIKSLVEWASLTAKEREENKHTEIFIDHNVAPDLRNACGMFIKLAMDLQDVLKWKDPAKLEVERYRRRYTNLVKQFQFLGTEVRVIDLGDNI